MFQYLVSKLTRPSLPGHRAHLKQGRQRGFERLEARIVMSANFGEVAGEAQTPSDLGQDFDAFPQVVTSRSSNLPKFSASAEFWQSTPGTNLAQSPHQPSTLSPDLFDHQSHVSGFATLDASPNLRASSQLLKILVIGTGQRGFPTTTYLVMHDPTMNSFGFARFSSSRLIGMEYALAATDPGGNIASHLEGGIPLAALLKKVRSTRDFFADTGTSVIRVDAVLASAPLYVSFVSADTQVDSNSFAISDTFVNDLARPVDYVSLSLKTEVSRLQQLTSTNVEQSITSDTSPEGLVDIDFADESQLSSRLAEEITQVGNDVNQLLRELHSPPSHSVKPDDHSLPLPRETIASPDEALSGEGGMVLLQAEQGKVSSELFLLDKAFAESGDLFDVNVRMVSAIGAYQAFHVGSPSTSSEQEPVRPASSSKSSTARSADKSDTPQSSRTTGFSTQVTSGALASVVAAVSIRLKSRGRQTRRNKDDLLTSLDGERSRELPRS